MPDHHSLQSTVAYIFVLWFEMIAIVVFVVIDLCSQLLMQLVCLNCLAQDSNTRSLGLEPSAITTGHWLYPNEIFRLTVQRFTTTSCY